MSKEVTIQVPGPNGFVPKVGVILDVLKENENWSSYTLENGATLRVKQVVTKVIMLNEKDQFGKPVYQIEANPIITVD